MSQSERLAALRGRYPYLIADIEEAPEITIKGNDGRLYRKKVFSFGDLGHWMTPELSREISHGLAEKIKKWQWKLDYLVALNPGGGGWGMFLTDECLVALVIGEVNRSEPLYEIVFEDEFRVKVGGPHGRELCFRGMEAGDRVVVVDDVISTGETIKGVVKAFSGRGIKVVGVLAIVTKGDGYLTIGQDFGVPVESLVNLDEEGKIKD